MLNQLGKIIRTTRTQKGININEYAAKLGVSAGYLSNLETGKTDTINLSLLEKLNEELHLFSTDSFEQNLDNTFQLRTKIAIDKLTKFNNGNPEKAEYLLSMLEKGLSLFEER